MKRKKLTEADVTAESVFMLKRRQVLKMLGISATALSLPAAAQAVNLANQDNNGRFDVKQHLQSPWNVLVGAQYELTQNFNITTEFGFAERNSFFIAGEYRF